MESLESRIASDTRVRATALADHAAGPARITPASTSARSAAAPATRAPASVAFEIFAAAFLASWSVDGDAPGAGCAKLRMVCTAHEREGDMPSRVAAGGVANAQSPNASTTKRCRAGGTVSDE